MCEKKTILKIENLKHYFKQDRKNVVKAVDGVTFSIKEGEIFSLVGESGSGKSTLGRTIIRLYNPSEGKIEFYNRDISGKLSKHDSRFLRTNMQMIYQDPMASLNPRMKVIDIVAQGLDISGKYSKEERKSKVVNILKEVGLSERHINRYPHQFSGGQKQRIGIARSMILKPKMIIADEPISALDVSIQAQVINLLKRLQVETGITFLFIAHDLSMVQHISDRLGVMHLGHMVEMGTVDDIYNNTIHPYTKSLLSAVPHPNPKLERIRKREFYSADKSDYEGQKWHQISDTHYVLSIKGE